MKKVIDYSITPVYFYRFVCNDPNISNMYVGSCIDLTKRKSGHKSVCNNPNDKGYNYLVYKTIRDNGGWDNWRLLEIENKIVKNKTEAKQREQYWIEYFNAQMNTHKLNFNRPENKRKYDNQHREDIIAKAREYRATHREERSAYQCEYQATHKEELSIQRREYEKLNRVEINRKALERKYRRKEQKMMGLEDINVNTN